MNSGDPRNHDDSVGVRELVTAMVVLQAEYDLEDVVVTRTLPDGTVMTVILAANDRLEFQRDGTVVWSVALGEFDSEWEKR